MKQTQALEWSNRLWIVALVCVLVGTCVHGFHGSEGLNRVFSIGWFVAFILAGVLWVLGRFVLKSDTNE